MVVWACFIDAIGLSLRVGVCCIQKNIYYCCMKESEFVVCSSKLIDVFILTLSY